MIVSFALEFDSEAAMRKAAKKLWEGLGISGEMEIRPLEGGRWRLDVHSEKPVREATIEALGGQRAKSRSAVGKL